MPEPENKITAEQAGEAMKKAFAALELGAQVMQQLPAILQILNSDEPAVLELLGDELVVQPWSACH